MSYGVWLTIDTGRGEREVQEVGNHTSNCAWMWAEVLGVPLRELNGANAGDSVELLKRGIDKFEEEFNRFKEKEPANGWGSAGSALDFLRRIHHYCSENPLCTIRMSY